MGTMGLALPWKASAAPTEWERIEAVNCAVPRPEQLAAYPAEESWNGTRISSAPRERGTRVEPSEPFAGGRSPAVVGCHERRCLTGRCLPVGRPARLRTALRHSRRAHEKPGAERSRQCQRRRRCRAGNIPESAAQHRELSRTIQFCHLDLPNPPQHLLRRAAQPAAEKGNRERRI